MCKATERSQRRHRAMYFAPSARPIHPQIVVPDGADPVLPLLVVAPAQPVDVATPPSTGPPIEEDEPRSISISLWRLPRFLWNVYHWFVDLFLLVLVCLMGCFFYDVEVKVVKSDRRQAMARGRSGRVVIQTDGPALPASTPQTPLHRNLSISRTTPPHSASRRVQVTPPHSASRRVQVTPPHSASRRVQVSSPSSTRSYGEVLPV